MGVESDGRECNCFSFKFAPVQICLRHTASEEPVSQKGVHLSGDPNTLKPFQTDEQSAP